MCPRLSGSPAAGGLTAGLLVAALLVAGCGGAPETPDGGDDTGPVAAGIPAAELGLDYDVFDAPEPPTWAANSSMPGEEPVLPRAYPGAPPVIPHGVDDFLPITNADNNCVLCHLAGGEKEEGGATPLPESHRTDWRRAPGKPGDEAVGARHNCLTCHVPRTDAPPLVGSSFGAAPGDRADETARAPGAAD